MPAILLAGNATEGGKAVSYMKSGVIFLGFDIDNRDTQMQLRLGTDWRAGVVRRNGDVLGRELTKFDSGDCGPRYTSWVNWDSIWHIV